MIFNYFLSIQSFDFSSQFDQLSHIKLTMAKMSALNFFLEELR